MAKEIKVFRRFPCFCLTNLSVKKKIRKKNFKFKSSCQENIFVKIHWILFLYKIFVKISFISKFPLHEISWTIFHITAMYSIWKRWRSNLCQDFFFWVINYSTDRYSFYMFSIYSSTLNSKLVQKYLRRKRKILKINFLTYWPVILITPIGTLNPKITIHCIFYTLVITWKLICFMTI